MSPDAREDSPQVDEENVTSNTNGNILAATSDESDLLHLPQSCGESFRDLLLRTLDHPFFQILGIIVIIGVIASGALFFFFLMGWQTLCRPRTDCEPRNQIYNISIQILNVFFTYMATFSMPWRCTNLIHTLGWGCPYRCNAIGHDLYGLPSDDVWFHVPQRKRLVILIFLLFNSLTQYANQATRIKYYSYDLQNTYPGNLWTNVFFGASMICAAIGGALHWHHTSKARKADRDRFGPGPIDLAKDLWRQHFGSSTKDPEPVTEEDPQHESSNEFPDPTRESRRRSVLGGNHRASRRMWGM